MALTISAQFSATAHTPEHIALAERLGYTRGWVFDTPHQSPDVWMTLTRAIAAPSFPDCSLVVPTWHVVMRCNACNFIRASQYVQSQTNVSVMNPVIGVPFDLPQCVGAGRATAAARRHRVAPPRRGIGRRIEGQLKCSVG